MTTEFKQEIEMKEEEEGNQEDNALTVRLIAQEGTCFDVPLNVSRMSELVRIMIDGPNYALPSFTPIV